MLSVTIEYVVLLENNLNSNNKNNIIVWSNNICRKKLIFINSKINIENKSILEKLKNIL